MKRTKHSWSVLFVLLVGAILSCSMLSCKRKSVPDQVIRVTRNLGGREGFRLHWEAWKAAFEEKNAGWKLELIDLGNSEGIEYYKSRIATNDLPEVIMTWELTNFLSDAGHLVPLPDRFYDQYGIPPPPPYKGQRYTSQGGIQIQGMVVNKAMWADAGIVEPPDTWEAFLAGLDKLKAKGYKPLVYGGREWSAFMPLMCGIHADLYDRKPDPSKPSWTQLKREKKVSFATDPTARIIMTNMVDLLTRFVDKGALSDGYNEEQRDFYGGKGATWIMGCWVGGDIEPNQVDFEMEYWPLPSMTGRPPVFFSNSDLQSGWAITTSAEGEKASKAMAVLDAFYDPKVYQLYLNGEAMFALAQKVTVQGPKSDWPQAQHLYESMAENLAQYGTTPGCYISLEDQPPHGADMGAMRVMQEILAGTTDVDRLLKMLDDEWDNAFKGE
jgi:ABC-type glycerol-3-phosphate transport system substrate-binding protein